MPDLLTHILIITPFKHRLKRNLTLLLVGTTLPDVIARIPGTIFPNSTKVGWAQNALHSPIGLILFCLLVCFFFTQEIRKNVFITLIFGVFIHLLLDLLQKSFITGYLWLFPFSFRSFQIPLFWPDESIFLIPIFLFLNFIFWMINKK